MTMPEVCDSSFEMGLLLDKRGAPLSPPRVNVLVCCFNYERFVTAALDSVLAQTYGNFDCTVVDDASTDGTLEAVQGWISEKRDHRFKLIHNGRNLGQMGSIAAALSVTQGEFVALLDADDFWLPDFLLRHVEVHLNRAQPAGASCSDLLQADADGRVLAGSTMIPAFALSNLYEKGRVLKPSDLPIIDRQRSASRYEPTDVRYVPADIGKWYWSVTTGMVFRRPLVELLLPSNTEELGLGADLYFMTLAHAFTGSFVIRNALGVYRRHGENNFSSLPVLGHTGLANSDVAFKNLRNVQRAMLEHLLSANDLLSAAFSPAVVRKRARSLHRNLLLLGLDVDTPPATRIIGRGQLMRDRFRAKIGFLRRGLT
jgi:glycosyltransferase involved in cell wall biosynthesis